MNCLKTILLLILILGARPDAFANITLDGLTLNPGPEWKYAKDLFGLPHTFLGKKKLSHRPTLSIIPIGDQDINQMLGPEDKAVQSFEQNRKLWVEENGGKVFEFFPYSKSTLSKNILHRFGFTYQLGESVFTEYSYYFSCKGKLHHVKSLALKSDAEGLVEIERLIQTIRCGE